ncbi:hypothetical protein MPSI1_003459 [Malassezia psittaci]|uniref:Uncharacterized protein n=1 Tax=Malassezia psittaci TaxID=1821823 RepID=A0AAF0JFJ0_9BASI|nr:hypothetical protein MPSI1_003459 [Malassezia psittaci]
MGDQRRALGTQQEFRADSPSSNKEQQGAARCRIPEILDGSRASSSYTPRSRARSAASTQKAIDRNECQRSHAHQNQELGPAAIASSRPGRSRHEIRRDLRTDQGSHSRVAQIRSQSPQITSYQGTRSERSRNRRADSSSSSTSRTDHSMHRTSLASARNSTLRETSASPSPAGRRNASGRNQTDRLDARSESGSGPRTESRRTQDPAKSSVAKTEKQTAFQESRRIEAEISRSQTILESCSMDDLDMTLQFTDAHRSYVPILPNNISYLNYSIDLILLLQDQHHRGYSRQLPDLHTILQRTYAQGVEHALDRVLDLLEGFIPTDPIDSERNPTIYQTVHTDPNHTPIKIPMAEVLTDVLERLLCYSYASIAHLYERATSSRVDRACVKWLGDLACRQLAFLRFLYAIRVSKDAQDQPRGRSPRRRSGLHSSQNSTEYDTDQCERVMTLARSVTIDEMDAWLVNALTWYGVAARETPREGHLVAAMAQIPTLTDIQSLYYYSKSVQVVYPCVDAPAWMSDHFTSSAQKTRCRADASLMELLMYLFGLLATRTNLDQFSTVLERVRQITSQQSKMTAAFSGTEYPHLLLETEWMMLGIITVAALFDFGRKNNHVDLRILAAHRISEHLRPCSDANLTRITNRPDPSASGWPDADPTTCFSSAIQHGYLSTTAYAMQLLIDLLSYAAALQHEAIHNLVAEINAPIPFLILVCSALQILALRASECPKARTLITIVSEHFPWASLETYANAKGSEALQSAKEALPEDWCLLGIAWNTFSPRLYHFIPATQNARAMTLAGSNLSESPTTTKHTNHDANVPNKSCCAYVTEPQMLSERCARSRHLASLKTHAYLSAYVQDPDMQSLLRARHARFQVVFTSLRDAINGVYESCSNE